MNAVYSYPSTSPVHPPAFDSNRLSGSGLQLSREEMRDGEDDLRGPGHLSRANLQSARPHGVG